MNEWHTNLEILKHYDLLKKTGIWEHFDQLNAKIKDQQELITEAIDLFQKHSINEIVDYVTGKLLNKFIPKDLVFLLQEGSHENNLQCIWFQNMKRIENEATVRNLLPCTDFFTKYPNSISYSLLEYKLGNESFSNSLRKYSPEFIVPIIGIGGLTGLILIGRKIVGEGYSREEIHYIDILMNFASMAIQNNLHHKSSITDFKTRLFNHSFFIRRLEEEMSRIERYDGEASLLVMDIDKFKNFNDLHGHLAGDQVLYQVSRCIQDAVRIEDIIARFGGEEFVVLLVNTPQIEAWHVAERIRTSIESTVVEFQGKALKVTISIGGCHINKFKFVHPKKLIEQADIALYESKDNGRNQTTFFKPGLYFKTAISKK